MILFLLILAIILGVLTIDSFSNSNQHGGPSLAVSAVSVIAIESLLYFWCRSISFPFQIGLFLWILLSASILFYRRKLIQIPNLNYRSDPIHLGGLAFILIASLLFYRYHSAYGAWDAVAVWNTHANFLASPDSSWQNLFNSTLSWSHPDYPLMIPSFIASFWYATDSITPIFPSLYHMGIMLLLLISFFKIIYDKHKLTALFFLGILCLDRHFIARMSSEYADTTIALLYMLISYVILDQRGKDKHPNSILLGFLTTIPLWTKNEGLPFFLIFISYYIFTNKKSPKRILNFIIGACPIVITFVHFKLALAPENLIVQSQNFESILQKVTDISRYKLIASKFVETIFWSFPQLVIASIIAAYINFKNKAKASATPTLLLLLCFLAYMAVYLVSPYDLEWHVQHSITRLIHQVYPAIMLVCAYTISIFFNKKEAFIF